MASLGFEGRAGGGGKLGLDFVVDVLWEVFWPVMRLCAYDCEGKLHVGCTSRYSVRECVSESAFQL